jgi:hypothetical protein
MNRTNRDALLRASATNALAVLDKHEGAIVRALRICRHAVSLSSAHPAGCPAGLRRGTMLHCRGQLLRARTLASAAHMAEAAVALALMIEGRAAAVQLGADESKLASPPRRRGRPRKNPEDCARPARAEKSAEQARAKAEAELAALLKAEGVNVDATADE